MNIDEQRELFPRGLTQPEDGYRFSLDSLLLASFARLPKKGGQGLDLGCGCGVIGLGVVLANPGIPLRVTGLDIQAEMIECAQRNRTNFGFEDCLEYALTDISTYKGLDNKADFVLANPPYRTQGQGRVSPGNSRATARFEGETGLVSFCKAALRALRDKAPLFMVHLPERLTEVVNACQTAGLMPKRVRFVHSREDEPACIMLLEARKNSGPGMLVEPPLVLYDESSGASGMTEDALAFCPFLQCNA